MYGDALILGQVKRMIIPTKGGLQALKVSHDPSVPPSVSMMVTGIVVSCDDRLRVRFQISSSAAHRTKLSICPDASKYCLLVLTSSRKV